MSPWSEPSFDWLTLTQNIRTTFPNPITAFRACTLSSDPMRVMHPRFSFLSDWQADKPARPSTGLNLTLFVYRIATKFDYNGRVIYIQLWKFFWITERAQFRQLFEDLGVQLVAKLLRNAVISCALYMCGIIFFNRPCARVSLLLNFNWWHRALHRRLAVRYFLWSLWNWRTGITADSLATVFNNKPRIVCASSIFWEMLQNDGKIRLLLSRVGLLPMSDAPCLNTGEVVWIISNRY